MWTSIFASPLIRQPTLISGTDPIASVTNTRVMAWLLPDATLPLHPGGHVDVITNCTELACVSGEFRRQD